MSDCARLRSRKLTSSLNHKNTFILNSKFPWSLSVKSQLNLPTSASEIIVLIWPTRTLAPPTVIPVPRMFRQALHPSNSTRDRGCEVAGASAIPRRGGHGRASHFPTFQVDDFIAQALNCGLQRFVLFSMILSSFSILSDQNFSRSF